MQQAIDSGRYQRPEDAAQEAFLLWAERERRRAEILAAVDKAEASFGQGKGRVVASEADTRQLAKDIKQRGRARLQAQEAQPANGQLSAFRRGRS